MMTSENLFLIIGGIIAAFGSIGYFGIGIFYGWWKIYTTEEMLSKQEFSKAVGLVSITSFMTGFGLTVMSLASTESLVDVGVLIPLTLCSGLFPMFMIYTFVSGIKQRGYLENVKWVKRQIDGETDNKHTLE